MKWKEAYTKIFLKQIGEADSSSNVKIHLPIWWKNTREKDEGGLRLTDEGWNVVQSIELANYEIPFPLDMPITTQIIIWLDHFIDCPYYLTSRAVYVTNEKKAVELTLFSGDIRKYGLAKALKRSKKIENSG